VALWLVGRRAVEVSRLPEPTRPAVVAPVPASAPIRVSAPDAEAAAELERLRAEVRDLREQLDAAHAALDQTVSTLDRTTLELERLRRPLEIDMASATLRASLVPGEGVVTGGYRLPDGNRLFAFVATDTMPDGSIGIASRFFSVPEDVARSLGLETLLTEAANTLQHGEVWVREELAEISARIAQAPTARLVSAAVSAIPLGQTTDVPIPADPDTPPLSLNVHAVYDEQDNLDLELRMESVPSETPLDAR